VSRDEAIDAEYHWQREATDPESLDGSGAREHLQEARRVRANTEREARNAEDDANSVEQAIVEQVRIWRRQGSDVRTALDRLELVDSALSTKRQSEIDQNSQNPPGYVIGLLGKQPSEQSRALRWRQGVVEIEDWRRSATMPTPSAKQDRWIAALGPPLDGWDGRRQRRVFANLRAVRRDLGLEDQELRATGESVRRHGLATAAVLNRRSEGLPTASGVVDGRGHPERGRSR
jgi:hypothetical protein